MPQPSVATRKTTHKERIALMAAQMRSKRSKHDPKSKAVARKSTCLLTPKKGTRRFVPTWVRLVPGGGASGR